MAKGITAYMDYNAATPVRPEAAAAVGRALCQPGNPSSVHGAGRAARQLVEEARAQVAALVGASPAGVIFTSGGTEANALGLLGCGRGVRLASAVDHPSVLAQDIGGRIPVDALGLIDLGELDRMLAQAPGPAVVSVMLANNETGVVQPVAEAGRIAHAHGALLHCDVAQAVGRIGVAIRQLNADLLTVSSHKLGGPAGAGALVLADEALALAPILRGGGQERRRRAGSENVAGIAGFGAAAKVAADELSGGAAMAKVSELRDRLEARAERMVGRAVVIGKAVNRLPNTCCLALPGVPAQIQVMALDLAGVAVSAGSACSSGKVAESHVLAAMGLDRSLAGSAIRVSLGWASRSEDVDAFLVAWADLAGRKGFEVDLAACAA